MFRSLKLLLSLFQIVLVACIVYGIAYCVQLFTHGVAYPGSVRAGRLYGGLLAGALHVCVCIVLTRTDRATQMEAKTGVWPGILLCIASIVLSYSGTEREWMIGITLALTSYVVAYLYALQTALIMLLCTGLAIVIPHSIIGTSMSPHVTTIVVLSLVWKTTTSILASESRTQAQTIDQSRWASLQLSSVLLALESKLRRERSLVVRGERQALARVIHDTVGYSMTALSVQLNALQNHMSDTEAMNRISRIEMLARKALRDMRVQVSELRQQPDNEEETPWSAKIHSLCETFQDCTGMQIVCDLDESVQLNAVQTAAVHRIVQEGITNAYRHGRSSCVTIATNWNLDLRLYMLKISDNGLGCRSFTVGNGLRGMRERVEALGGSMVVQTRADEGFDIGVDLPIGIG